MVDTCCYRLQIKLAGMAHTQSLRFGRAISRNCWKTRIKKATDRRIAIHKIVCRNARGRSVQSRLIYQGRGRWYSSHRSMSPCAILEMPADAEDDFYPWTGRDDWRL